MMHIPCNNSSFDAIYIQIFIDEVIHMHGYLCDGGLMGNGCQKGMSDIRVQLGVILQHPPC